MQTWLKHPKYAATRDRLVQYLSSPSYRFRRLERVLFFCGGAGSPAREALRTYFSKHAPWHSVFYAESVWEKIASEVDGDALQMESKLAALADLCLVIVESPGTFAELGAFSLSDSLRKKLLPIVDDKYRGTKSFIATGPLRWIDKESLFAPTIYVPLSKILRSVDQIEERIDRIVRTPAIKISDLAASPKHLLFFLCDLIAVTYPVTLEMVEYYIERIAPSVQQSAIGIPTLIGLAIAMGLLKEQAKTVDGNLENFLSPVSSTAIEHPYHHPIRDLPSQRADHVSVLLSLPLPREILSELRSGS